MIEVEEFYRKVKRLREPRTVDLGVFGIKIEYLGPRVISIESNLKETCGCNPAFNCVCELNDYNMAIDGLEAFLLSLAGAGVDMTTPQIKEAIESAAEALGNSL